MKCKNCGAELMEGIIFCPECGEKNETDGQNEYQPDQEEVKQGTEDIVSETTEPVGLNREPQPDPAQEEKQEISKKYCPQCGTENVEDAVFCGNCGFSFTGLTSTGKPEKQKKSGLKKVLIAAAAVAGVVALGFGAYTVFSAGGIVGNNNNKDTSKKLLYLKDNEINIVAGKKPIAIDGDICDDNYSESNFGGTYCPISFSEDGKYMFYPQDYTGSGYYDLYRRKTNSTKDKGDKFASGVLWYEVIDNNRIAYLKDDDRKLYISSKDDKQRVDSDVRIFTISDDKKNILWITSDSDMYVQSINLKKDKIELDSNVRYILYKSEDMDTVIYKSQDNDLYVMKDFADREKIDSNVEEAIASVKNGKLTLNYCKSVDSEKALCYGDFVNDDMAASDALMKEPNISDYQKTEMKDSFWGPMESTETDYDAYNAAYEQYEQKLNRDAVRKSEYFKTPITNVYCKELYFYDVKAKKKELVTSLTTKNVYTKNSGTTITEDIVVVDYYDVDNIDKIEISDITEASELWDKVTDSLENNTKTCVMKGKTNIELDMSAGEYGALGCAYTSEDMLYLLYGKDNGYLLSTDLSKDKGVTKELSDEVDEIEFADKKGVYYTVSVDNDGIGELYLNDKRIVDEVVPGSVQPFGNSLIYTDETNEQEFTLMLYKNGKKQTVSDEVADYYILDDDRIALLVDYSTKRYKGDLKLYDNGKVKDIDTDVSAILRY